MLGAGYGFTILNRKDSSVEAIARRQKKAERNRGKGNVDKEFRERVIKLVKQIIPHWNCREVTYISVLAGLLIVRTLMSIWLADVNGRVV